MEFYLHCDPSKCKFALNELTFLGHHLNSQSVCPLDGKVPAIRDFPQLSTQCKLCEFLGLVNFYHNFIPHCAHTPTTEQSTFQS